MTLALLVERRGTWPCKDPRKALVSARAKVDAVWHCFYAKGDLFWVAE